jgi:hypothetical protein
LPEILNESEEGKPDTGDGDEEEPKSGPAAEMMQNEWGRPRKVFTF